MTAIRSRTARARFIRFVVVGLGAALLLFLLTYLFLSLGVAPMAASLVAYALAFATAYSAQRRWTFGGRHSHGHAFPRYLAVQAGCALTSALATYLAAKGFALPPLALSAVTTIVASGASYLLALYWVFPDRAATD